MDFNFRKKCILLCGHNKKFSFYFGTVLNAYPLTHIFNTCNKRIQCKLHYYNNFASIHTMNAIVQPKNICCWSLIPKDVFRRYDFFFRLTIEGVYRPCFNKTATLTPGANSGGFLWRSNTGKPLQLFKSEVKSAYLCIGLLNAQL